MARKRNKNNATASLERVEISDGLYGEKLIEPARIEYKYDVENDFEYCVVTTTDGEEIKIESPAAMRMFFYYYRSKLDFPLKELKNKDWNEKTKIINELITKYPKKFKLQLDNKTGEVLFVRSERFNQISWRDIRAAVESTIMEIYGEMPEHFDRLPNAWNFKIPIQHEWLDFWYEVYAGHNLGLKANKSIQIRVRARTIKALKGMDSPCLNWSTFHVPAHWFRIKTRHIRDIMPKIPNLSVRTIHLKGQNIQKVTKEHLVKIFKEQREALEDSIKVLDKYIHHSLTEDDIKAIVEAYKEYYKLPKYVVEDVYDLIKEPTIFGLSNAFSFFRTHCEYKRTKKPREEAGLTRKLDFIAGELIVVSPLIVELKKKFGTLSKELLLEPKKVAPEES